MYCNNCGYYANVVDTWQCPNCYNVNYVPTPEKTWLETVKCKMQDKKYRRSVYITALCIFGALVILGLAFCVREEQEKRIIEHSVPGYEFTVGANMLWTEDTDPGEFSLILNKSYEELYFCVMGWNEDELSEDITYQDLQNAEIEAMSQEESSLEIFQSNEVILDTENKKICAAGFFVEQEEQRAECYSYAIELPESGEKVWVLVMGDYLENHQDEIEAMVMSIE